MRRPYQRWPAGVRRRAALTALLALAALVLSGCGAEAGQWGRLGFPEGATEESARVQSLWNGAWFFALLVGALVWGLIAWACVFFRRRRDERGLPPQVRYNVPIEVLYTVTPLLAVLVYFFFTARDEAELLELQPLQPGASHQINVVGKQWSWDFNYEFQNPQQAVYEDGTPGETPTLYLPRGERVEFVLTARDVIHSFWVPAFLFKMDTIPGRVNTFQVVPNKNGTFLGKCAELCGQDHSRMLFNVRVVERADYDAHLQSLRDRGQTGQLPADLGPRAPTESQTESESRQ